MYIFRVGQSKIRERTREQGNYTVFCMSEKSFPYVPRAVLNRLFSVSVQKSLPTDRDRQREREGGGEERA